MTSKLRLTTLVAISLSSAMVAAPISQAAGLSELYQEAVTTDPQLRRTEAEVDITKAQERQSFGGLLPQVSASGSITRNHYDQLTSIHYTGERYNLTARQPLLNMEAWYDYKRTEHDTNRQQALYDDAKSNLALDLTTRYLGVLAAENSLKLAESEQKSVEEQLKVLYSRQKRQLAVKTDILDVEARLQSIKVDVIDARNQVDISRESLTQLINRPLFEKLDDFAEKIPFEPDEQPMEHWVEDGYKQSPQYRSLQEEVNSAHKLIKKNRSRHLPTVDLQLSAQHSNIGSENARIDTTTSYTLGFKISVPIYSGGRTSAAVEEGYARLTVAEQRQEQLRRELKKTISEAYLNTQSSWNRIQAGQAAIDAAKKSHEAMEQGFKYGTVTVIDVLDALREKLQRELEFKQSQYDFIANYMQLLHLSGHLDQNQVEIISRWQK